MSTQGLMIPLTELMSIEMEVSHPMILSKNLHMMSNVMAETDMVSRVYPLMDARNTILKTFSDTYTIKKIGLFNLQLTDKESAKVYKLIWDGEMEVTLDTFVELGAAFIAALVLIFLTATSLIGFIALIGISSRNSLLLIDFTKSLMQDKDMDQASAIAHSAATRAKPIFLTAVAIMLASTLLAGDAVFGGLGVSLIFGTVAAVVASLLVVPVLLNITDLKKQFDIE